MSPLSVLKTAAVFLALSAPLAQSASLRSCDSHEANVRNLVLPLEQGVRRFANGAINLFNLFQEEPACCGAHLIVTHPDPNAHYGQGCLLISNESNLGFSDINIQQAIAHYDPAVGLSIEVPATTWDGQRNTQHWLRITVNQATGQVWVERE